MTSFATTYYLSFWIDQERSERNQQTWNQNPYTPRSLKILGRDQKASLAQPPSTMDCRVVFTFTCCK
ncbi:hypothetical protein E2C01_075247 [Portunus trituberculatus]|uniref:Uncharacterized protein n=1 Tax=Portunus trituberculatus TaxID=210409 RepID=A0A5B7I5N2_PORTR|nr:hypothetical protein [Portunus trituberculatus]